MNTKEDILLRKDQVNTKEDNKDVYMLKEELWTRRMTVEVTILKRITKIEDSDILKEIRNNNTREKEVFQVMNKENSETWEEEGIVYKEARIYVLNNKKLKEKILKENHNSVDVGHPGQHRMLELLKGTYWRPGLKENVKKYIQGCFRYQQNKVQYQRKAGELHPLEISQGPWQEISIDIIRPLPRSNRMDTIVVIIDQFTKMI